MTMFIFLGILFQDLKLIFYILAALIIVTTALYIVGRLLIYLLGFVNFINSRGWKIGARNIIQRSNESILQIIIFGLSLLFLIVLTETRTDLIDSWSDTLEEDTPNYFLFNIQEYDLDNIFKYFQSEAALNPEFTPLIRGRLLSAKRFNSDQLSSENLMEREANLTWSESLPKSNSISKGKWWGKQNTKSEVSVDREVAESMNLNIGDELLFSAGGSNFNATVTSFREIEWESFSPNFFHIFQSWQKTTKLYNKYQNTSDMNIMKKFISNFPLFQALI